MTRTSAELQSVVDAFGPRARRHAPFGALTTYRVGGPATLMVEVATESELSDLAGHLQGTEIPLMVMGRGSNLLVSDRGYPGVVVVLGATFATMAIVDSEVEAGAGLALPVLARKTAAAGLTGLEWAVGVPGSVGGAIRMNAGGHGSDTARTLHAVRWIDLRSGSVHEVPAASLDLSYRTSNVAPDHVVTSGSYRLANGDAEHSAAELSEIVRWRRANQPGGSNAGSVFANPSGHSAGQMIDDAGLKGFRIGSAAVSEKHANFIQADEGGSAEDVLRVMDHVRREVERRWGITLASEVRLVGFQGPPSMPGSEP